MNDYSLSMAVELLVEIHTGTKYIALLKLVLKIFVPVVNRCLVRGVCCFSVIALIPLMSPKDTEGNMLVLQSLDLST